MMFVSIADWLSREGRLTRGDCPVEIEGEGVRSRRFRCVDTNRRNLPDRERHEINDGMWVAIPKTQDWRAERAKQLLKEFKVDPQHVALLMAEK